MTTSKPDKNPAKAWPTELKLSKDKRSLSITFDDGETFDIRAELLRVESPSAEVQGHGPSQKKLILGKEEIEITGIEPVGNYAARILFSDDHNTGLFTWGYLRKLGAEGAEIWAAYVAARTSAQMSKGS